MEKTPSHVAEWATIRNAITPTKITLIGVVGTADERRALVRLPSGRVRTVEVGDALNGGRVVSIGPAELGVARAGRLRSLTLPP